MDTYTETVEKQREFFAAYALVGLLASQHSGYSYSNKRDAATEAIQYADALIEVLEETKKQD